MLVKPADEEENYNAKINGQNDDPDLDKHVLSPLLVDAISKTAQVVWAHTKEQEGLLGRSDIRLQTAVGMPVAVDSSGNMCVVVMFSPNSISSTDDAMEYLQSISRSATSTSIPSLLPAFDPRQGLVSLPHQHSSSQSLPLLSLPALTNATTRFVSLEQSNVGPQALELPEVHSDHDLVNAPKDCFGIPMLPSVAELGGSGSTHFIDIQGNDGADVFDEASYGVWSTIMQNVDPVSQATTNGSKVKECGITDAENPVYASIAPEMAVERKERLHEFSSAFLGVSVFDAAEVWVPVDSKSEYLGQVTSVSTTNTNEALNAFRRTSQRILVKHWSGAVGRAFASGNPVWSTNQVSLIDFQRVICIRGISLP